MKRREFLFILNSIFLNWLTFAGTEELNKEWKNFTNSINTQWKETLKAFEQEWKQFIKDLHKEWKEYREEISRIWKGNYEDPEPKKLVIYSKDKRTKKVYKINEEKIEIRIEKLRRTKASSIKREEIEKDVKELVKYSQKDIIENVKPIKNIKEKYKRSKYVVTADKYSTEPLATEVITGKEKPSEKEIDKAVREHVSNAKREVKRIGNLILEIFRIEIFRPSRYILLKARKFKPIILKYSNRWNHPPELIYAIIHVESAFNPYAISPANAYGLMQIVPYTAGVDVAKYLYGRPLIFSPDYLLNPDNNVYIGTTYVHLLMNERYFKNVENFYKRLVCSVAAYNAGPGRISKIFGRSLQSAIRRINQLSEQEVLDNVITKAPLETRNYVKKVLSLMSIYAEKEELLS